MTNVTNGDGRNAGGLLQPLETSRLILRGLAPTDADSIFRHFSHPAVTEHLLDEEPMTHLDQAHDLIAFFSHPADKSYNRWGITLKGHDQVIGTLGYHLWNRRDQRAEIGYDLHPDYWGQGLMAEALRAVISFGFQSMNLHRIAAVVFEENQRSVALVERLGFCLEGVLRDYHYARGRRHDHRLYSLLRNEWKG